MEDLAVLPEMDGSYDSSADAFYEEIEAPKFVDLTDKDPVRVDDRYWFCSRVGCDQKHEEEMDSEEVYKNFVLRVMAARSPNVRLQKALSRRCGPSTKAKCPQSAPPKSTRPQVSRLALVASSMAKRTDGLKSKCIEQGTKKAIITPNTKVKVVGAKYMTTPKNKNLETKHDAFRSVQNLKSGGACVEEDKSKVAKTLVFHSPKKTVKLKSSLELKTPVRKICDKLKKLDLDDESRKKRVLGYSPKKITSSSSKPKDTPTRPWRVDKNVRQVENKKRKSKDMSQPCDRLLKSSDDNLVHDDLGKVEKHEVLLQDVKVAEEQQCTPETQVIVVAEGDDDKENESGTDQNRCTSGAKPEDSHSNSQKIPTLEKTGKKILRVTRPMMILKEGNAADAQGVKYSKLKPTNPKPFRLRTDERGILKEAQSEKVTSVRKCNEEIITESVSKKVSKLNSNAVKKVSKLNSNAVKKVQEKPQCITRVPKPINACTAPLERSKVISSVMTTKTPEKPKSILMSSTKRKTVTPSRENIARKPTVSFLLPEEKTPEVFNPVKCEKLKKDSNQKSPARDRKTQTAKISSAWRLP